jgi:hypothetical protein
VPSSVSCFHVASSTPPLVVRRVVAGPGSGYGSPGFSSRSSFHCSWGWSRGLVSNSRRWCCCRGCRGGFWLWRFRGSCSSTDRGLTRARPMETIRDRAPGADGPRRQRRSAGFRSSTQNPRRRVCATIARRGWGCVVDGRFASVSASCRGCGRSGRGRRGVPSERGPESPRETAAGGYNQPRLRGLMHAREQSGPRPRSGRVPASTAKPGRAGCWFGLGAAAEQASYAGSRRRLLVFDHCGSGNYHTVGRSEGHCRCRVGRVMGMMLVVAAYMLSGSYGGRESHLPRFGVRAMTAGSVSARAGGAAPRSFAATIGVLALAMVVLTTWAVPAVGKSGSRTRSFSTGSFAVYCTSTGELCTPPEKLTFSLRGPGTLTSITYTTAATHCSPVLLHVLRNGDQIAKTGRLAAGQQTERLVTHIRLSKGATTLGFQAQGFVGGCNVGRVFSWGGKVTVTVNVAR